MQGNLKIVVCLPTRNEVESIGQMIDGIQAVGLDLFISDSHSDDGTLEICKEKGVPVYQRADRGFGQGYGSGIQNGLQVAHELGYDIMVIIDCDTTYPTDKIPDLLKYVPEYDMVVGARNFEAIEWSHRLANIIHTGWYNILFGAKIKDVNSGMRALKVDKFRGHLSATNMGMVAQMSGFARRNGLKMIDVPVQYGKRKGESKIYAIDGVPIMYEILKERFKKRIAN